MPLAPLLVNEVYRSSPRLSGSIAAETAGPHIIGSADSVGPLPVVVAVAADLRVAADVEDMRGCLDRPRSAKGLSCLGRPGLTPTAAVQVPPLPTLYPIPEVLANCIDVAVTWLIRHVPLAAALSVTPLI